MPSEVAGVLQTASAQGPVVVIAALFGLYALGLTGITFGAIVKVLKMHSEKVERLTGSLSLAIQTMTTEQGRREERMTNALHEAATSQARVERALGQLPLLRANGIG
jgi:hypothetical protein